MADLNPKPSEVADKVPSLRTTFKEKYADNIKQGLYDARDLERIEKDDPYVRCFLRSLKSRGDVTKAIEIIDETFKFRKQIGIWDLNEDSFPDEMKDHKGIYFKGQAIGGFPILYINVKENVATADQQQVLKQYIAWNIDLHHRKNPEQMCVCLMDMHGAGMGNIGVDVTKYIIACFSHYFPAFLAYMINYEMPTLLSAAWSVISTFLNSDQKNKLLMVRKKDITKYVPEEHLWPHMK